MTAPPEPPFPPDLQGGPALVVGVARRSDLGAGGEVLAPLKRTCPPALDLVGPMPYVALQSMLDATAPHGWGYHDRMHYLEEASDGFVDALLAGYEQAPFPQCHVITGWMGGAIADVPAGATAFGHRRALAFTWIIGCSGDAPVGPAADWARALWSATAPWAADGVYVHGLGAE